MTTETPDSLDELNAIVARAVAEKPELKTLEQQVRASFGISDLLLTLLRQADVLPFDAGNNSGISASIVEEMLDATSEEPVTVALVSKLIGGIGYRLQVIFFPTQPWLQSINQGQNQNPVDISQNVSFEFAYSGDKKPHDEANVIRGGIKQLTENLLLISDSSKHTKALAAAHELAERAFDGTTFAALLSLADKIDFKIQIRFIPVKSSIARQHPRNIETTFQASGVLLDFQSSRGQNTDLLNGL